MACLRAAGHRGAHESLFWRAVEMDAFDRGVDAMRAKIAEWLANGPYRIDQIPPPEDS